MPDPAARPRPVLASIAKTALRVVNGRVFRWGFVAVAVALGAYAVAVQWSQVTQAIGRIGLPAVVLALVSVLLAQFAMVLCWRGLLGGLGSRLPVPAAARIVFLGQLGKYLPGAVWPVLTQMELGRSYRVPRHRSASASVLVMVMVLLTGLLTALVMLPFTGVTAYRWAFALTPVLLASLHPRVLNYLMGRLLRLARLAPLEHPLDGRTIAVALGWSFAVWIFNGVQIWLLTIRLGAPLGHSLLLSVGGYAFAWSVGFVVVFAPAGAGPRDLLLVAMFTQGLGLTASGALAVALVSRALTTVADLLAAATAGALGRRAGPGAADTAGDAPAAGDAAASGSARAPEPGAAGRV